MMKNIRKTVEEITAMLATEKVVYPCDLLRKHDSNNKFDAENLGYLVNGKEAGAYFHWLTLLAKHSDAKLIVELGNRYGTSTLALYHGMNEDQHLITIDTEHDQRYLPPEILNDPRIDFVFGDCIQLGSYVKSGTEIPTDIDVLWSDTIHFDEQITAEFFVYEPLLADEALIIIDDIHLNDKGKFFDRMDFWKIDLAKECHVNGYGVIHYVRAQQERGKSKDERIQQAILRSAEVYQRRWLQLHDSLQELKNRSSYIRKEQRRTAIKKLLGPVIMEKINNVRFNRKP